MHQTEPFFGWLDLYSNESDPDSPFHEEDHNQFFFDRKVYDYYAHPLWESIGSEGLLLKILFVDYDTGYAVIELFGVWNDLLENDFAMLYNNCLSALVSNGIRKFIFIAENVLNIYLDADDYYQAMQEECEDGWMCLINAREHVIAELNQYNIGAYFFWSPDIDDLRWRKLKPWQLFAAVEISMRKVLP